MKTRWFLGCCWSLVSCLICAGELGAAEIAITEVMYRPVKCVYKIPRDPINKTPVWKCDGESSGEYVELLNLGEETVDLSRWSLVDDQGLLFAFPMGTALDPGAYIVVAADAAALSERYNIENVMGDFLEGGRLSNGAETLSLFNDTPELVDDVRYRDDPPWPIEPDQSGLSLEVLDPRSDNSLAANWRTSRREPNQRPASASQGDEFFLLGGTPGAANSVSSDGLPPFVDASTIQHLPARPTSSDVVTLTAEVTSDETIARVTLECEVFTAPYQASVEVLSLEMLDDGGDDGEPGDGVYGVQMAGLSSQTLVRYRIQATDTSGRSWTYPDEAEANPNRAYFVYDGEEESDFAAYFLIIPQDNLDSLNADVWTPDFVDATWVIDGMVYDHIGVHFRGRGWRVHPKKSWRVRFNKGELFRGMSKIDVVMHFPSMQHLAFNLFEMVGARRIGTEIVRQYRNGEFVGVYLVQEGPNRSWLRSKGLSGNGEVYKASTAPQYDGGNPGYSGTEVSDLRHFEEPSLYPILWEKKSDNIGSYDSLIELTDIISNTPDEQLFDVLQQTIELDDWLYSWSVQVIAGNTDIIGTNYLIVNPAEPELKWQYYHFDFSHFFGCKGIDFNDVVCHPPSLDPFRYVNRFYERAATNPEVRNRFLVILKDVLENYMTVARIESLLADALDSTEFGRLQELKAEPTWQNFPGPYVIADPDPQEIADYFPARHDYLLNEWIPGQEFTPPANAHPTIVLGEPVVDEDGVLITWTHEDAEGDPSTVDLFWTDKKFSGHVPIEEAQDIPAEDGVFLWNDPAGQLKSEIFVHAVIRDGMSDLVGRDTLDPTPFPEPPSLSHQGGQVESPFELMLENPNERESAIVYTLNGPDPRRNRGTAPEALVYSGPIVLTENTAVRARIRLVVDGRNFWSAMEEASFGLTRPTLAVTEIMFHPQDGTDFEFLELFNFGDEPVDLTKISFSQGLEFDFAESAFPTVEPGEYFVVIHDVAAFSSLYDPSDIKIAGQSEGFLSNRGETIALVEDPVSISFLSFPYSQRWYPETAGGGHSLVLIDPRSSPETWSEPSSWRPGSEVNGSPGKADPGDPRGGAQLAGDSNQDGKFNISDAIHLLVFLFLGNVESLACGDGTVDDAANVGLLDTDGSQVVDITDAFYNLVYLFGSGPAPVQGDECVNIINCPNLCSP